LEFSNQSEHFTAEPISSNSDYNFIMEGDCMENISSSNVPHGEVDISQLFVKLSNQITDQVTMIQEQIVHNNSTMLQDIQRIAQENETFKATIRAELDNMKTLFHDHQVSSHSTQVQSVVDSTSSTLPVSSPSVVISNQASSGSHTVAPTVSLDFQTDMMRMLTESFSKLSTVLAEKKDDTKSDWPKFAGDPKKFRSWYLTILTQLSLPPWKELYDPLTKDVVLSTPNTLLNEKLYAKLLLALEGSAFQSIVNRDHLRANGLFLLQDLVQTYRPKNVPEVIAAKTTMFWGSTKRMSSESIDDYYNRFRDLLYDINGDVERIPLKDAMRHFVFTLGSEFETIQNNFRIDNLPVKWQTNDWSVLLVLCRDYYNSVRPYGILQPSSSISGHIDHTAHRKKVKIWFMNPTKYSKEIAAEQAKHPNKCLYHLSKTHLTDKCNVKLECDALIASQKSTSSGTAMTNSGRLRHVTEETYEDALTEDVVEDVDENGVNDTNEEELIYFARLTNHYLRLVKVSDPSTSVSSLQYPIIADSGANHHMFKEREFFSHLVPTSGRVILGDGKTSLPIKGVGTVNCRIGKHVLFIPNVRWVPDLSESIYSLFLHIQSPNHSIRSSFEEGLLIFFPGFETKAIVGTHDIYLDAVPCHQNNTTVSSTVNADILQEKSSVCHHISQFQSEIDIESSKVDNILRSLRRYYNEVKTKRQLNMEVPAGFRQVNKMQSDFAYHDSLKHSTMSVSGTVPVDTSFQQDLSQNLESTSTIDLGLVSDFLDTCSPNSTNNTNSSSTSSYIPIVRSVDKSSSSLPNMITMNEDYIRASVGFRRIESIKQHLPSLYQNTIQLDHTPADAILDVGHFANLRKTKRNTTPVPRPSFFGDTIHMDIVFGPEVAIGNVHFGLFFTDRFSRMNYIYPLQNLTTDIPRQMNAFFAHIGTLPKRLISDFDLKLIGGKARDHLNSLLIHVNAAPAMRQDRNGLAERHWQTMVSMARSWLASAELPANFWFFAVRRAAEICNYFPYKLEDGSFTTPFELAHQVKPDLRVLFKLFALAAVRRERVGDISLQKFDSQSLPMIAVGKCPNSPGIQFYNPENGTLVSSIDYKFQHHVTSGAFFGLKYQSGTFLYRLDEGNTIFTPQFNLDATVLVNTHSPPHQATVIGLPTYDRPHIYTVSFSDGSIAEYSDDVLELSSKGHNVSSSTLLPAWVKGGANCTLFLRHMSKPRHGKLFQDSSQLWVFCPGNTTDLTSGISLPQFEANFQELLDTGQLFKGHSKFRRVYAARNQLQLRDCVLRHVSAHGLSSLIAPTSLKQHQSMSENDKVIWDAAYDEEYEGLNDLPTWDILTENQFKSLSKGVKALPSMALATIKYDANNRPKRAKYRIVVLGNLDYHNWSKESTAAPVMSQLELRLLTSLATSHRRVLKNCDIKQAFVQSSIPEDEQYFVKPPVGCYRSSPGTIWKLTRSLYGLRRAPRLWFEKLCSHLKSMGLKNSDTSPCLFVGSLLEGGPLIYIGVYVDDIIYFSPCDNVEKKFESLLSSIGSIDFMGQVTHFLGIEFQWKYHTDGNLSVSLTQQSFVEALLESLQIHHYSPSSYTTPYQTGMSIDTIPSVSLPTGEQDKLRLQYQSIVGSLNWLAHTTRPDISTAVSLLAQHQSQPSPGHLDAALYVVRYLASTKTLGIYYSSSKRSTMEAFLHFPLSPKVLSMADANWGPQDARQTKKSIELPLFTSRSMSAFYIDLFGPLHWLSKRQSVTAGSSAEAEIYATDKCVKFLIELSQIMDFLGICHQFMPSTNIIFNDNRACVNWSKRTTTKGLRHIQMKENRVRENILNDFVRICHIDGKINLADLFTKEMKDVSHFVELRNLMMCSRLSS